MKKQHPSELELLWDFCCRYREELLRSNTEEIPHNARRFTEQYAKANTAQKQRTPSTMVQMTAQEWLDSKDEFVCDVCGRKSIGHKEGDKCNLPTPRGERCPGMFKEDNFTL